MTLEKTYDPAGNLLFINQNHWSSQQAFEDVVDALDSAGTSVGSVSIVDKGADPTGSDDSSQAIIDAIEEAAATGKSVYVPPGTFIYDRQSGTNYGLLLSGLTDVTIWGQPGLSILKAAPDIATGFGECKGILIRGCSNLRLQGLVIDGGWENAATTVGETGHLLELPETTIPVVSTAGFASSGTFELMTREGMQLITYTGKTATTFTGCSGGSGLMRTGNVIVAFTRGQSTRSVAAASDGVDLAVATELTLYGDLSQWPNSAALGEVRILTSNGWDYIGYVSRAGNTLGGIFGASGTVDGADDGTGSTVQLILGQGGQQAENPSYAQVDPKNHAVFIYGDDGFNNAMPNYGVTLSDCRIINAYGDGVWIGQRSYDTTLSNTEIYLAARNGITLTSYAEGVVLNNVRVIYSGTTPLDSEPVEGPVRGVRANAVKLLPWPNQGTVNPNVVLSIWGGSETRPNEQNLASDWRFVNCSFLRGSTWLANCRSIYFSQCNFDNDLDSDVAISTSPLLLDRFCNDIWARDCYFNGRRSSGTTAGLGVIGMVAYRQGSSAATVPADVHIHGGRIVARDEMVGVYIEAVGGYASFSGTATSYTAPVSPATDAVLTFSGTPFAGMNNFFVGRQVLLNGVLANIVGNTSNTLSLAPIAANYTVGNVWSDRRGQVAATPSMGTAVVLPVGGWIDIQNVTIDCGQTDDSPAGEQGILFDPTATFEEGYNQLRISLKNNIIINPTGAGIDINARGTNNPNVYAELELVDNKIHDDRPTKLCTTGLRVVFPAFWGMIEQHGNKVTPGIPLLNEEWEQVTCYIAESAYPPVYAGYSTPEGAVFAPKQSLFKWISANATLQKQSIEDYATSWVEVKTQPRVALRSAGSFTGTTTADIEPDNNYPALTNDIEILQVSTVSPTAPAFAGGDAKGFTLIDYAEATHFSATLRTTWYWRRKTFGDENPTITTNDCEVRLWSIKDAISTGDPVDAYTVGNNTSGALSFSIAGPTSTVPNALMVTFVTCFTGSSTDTTLGNISCNQPAVLELTQEWATDPTIGSDRWLSTAITGRRVAAGSMGTVSGDISSAPANYSFTMAITLAIKPLEE